MSGPRYPVSVPDLAWWLERVPCQMGCPVHTDCGRYVQLVAHGLPREGYLAARSPNPLASVCGRVCAAPCEDRCRRGKIDSPVSIRAIKRYLTERYGLESNDPRASAELQQGAVDEPGSTWPGHLRSLRGAKGEGGGRRVAVVGAGPAGLACAHDLALMGYAVTVFEASGRAGGMAFHGIPEFRLPRAVLDREIAAIASLGVAFRYETPLSPAFGLAQLKAQGFEAVFLAVGVQRGRDLSCPGRELDGIVRAIDFLLNANHGYRVPSAKKVLVLGGGFVAFDAARVALRAVEAVGEGEPGPGMDALDAARIAARAGAEVTLVSLESLEEMPARRTEQGREEFEHTLGEGVRFLPQRSVKRFEGTQRVERVQLVGVRRTYDEAGRFAPVFDESVEDSREADLVILAIGQRPDLDFLSDRDGVRLTKAGTVEVDPETLATSAPGVFAGGDVAFGPRNLIDAEADGKRAARSIHALLADGAARARPATRLRFEKIPTARYERLEDYDLVPRQAPPAVELGRRTGISEVELGYDEAQARRQAERCLACHVQTVYDAQRCVLCNRCVDVCPEDCLKLVPVEQLQVSDPAPAAALAAARRGGGVEEGQAASAMLKDDERCIRCGLCAIRCPVDAMTMEVLHYEQR